MDNKLVKSAVSFDEEQHTYNLAGLELQGITGILSRQIFGHKYDGVPEAVLENARQYGTYVHGICELMDTIGADPVCKEAENYIEIVAENNLKHVASEYLISDEEYAASSIDKVYKGENENEYFIADIKTTSVLDEDYLAWQLGCYKYMFELQNPGCKVAKCYAIWLRHERYELREIEPKAKEDCQELIALDKAGEITYGEKYDIFYGRKQEEIPNDMLAQENRLYELTKQKEDIERQIAELKEDFMQRMSDDNASTWRGYSLTITRKADSKRTDFDKKKFQSEHADLYGQYTKETTIKGSISVRMA